MFCIIFSEALQDSVLHQQSGIICVSLSYLAR